MSVSRCLFRTCCLHILFVRRTCYFPLEKARSWRNCECTKKTHWTQVLGSPAQLRWQRNEKSWRKKNDRDDSERDGDRVVVIVIRSENARALGDEDFDLVKWKQVLCASLDTQPANNWSKVEIRFYSSTKTVFFSSAFFFMLDANIHSYFCTHFARSQWRQIFSRSQSLSFIRMRIDTRRWIGVDDWVRKRFSLSLSRRASWNGNRLINNNY